MASSEEEDSERTETDTEEEEEEEKKTQKPKKATKALVNKWTPFAIHASEVDLFANGPPDVKWMQAVTDVRGCCSVDTIALAFGLDRTPETWKTLRDDVASFNHAGISDQTRKLFPNEHLETDDVAYLSLSRFDTVPIILHSVEARKQQSGLRFAISSLFYSEMDRIERETKKDNIPVRYIVVKYILFGSQAKQANVFTQQGVGHFVALGTKTTSQADKNITTLFTEDHLPEGMLDAFYKTLNDQRDFYTLPLAQRRKNAKKSTQEPIVIE